MNNEYEITYIDKDGVHSCLTTDKELWDRVLSKKPDCPVRGRGRRNGKVVTAYAGPKYDEWDELYLCVSVDYGSGKLYTFYTHKWRDFTHNTNKGWLTVLAKRGKEIDVKVESCGYRHVDDVRAEQFEKNLDVIRFIEEVLV